MRHALQPDTPKGKVKSLRRLAGYLRPYKLKIAIALVALMFTSFAVIGMGGVLRFLVDEGLSKENPDILDRALGIMLGVILLLSTATYVRYYLVSWVGERVVADLRESVYRHLLIMDIGFFETSRTGDVLSRITTDTTLLQTVVGSSVSVALRHFIMLCGGTTMLFVTSPKLALCVFLILPFVMVPILVVGRKVRALSRASQDRVGDVSVSAEETLYGIRTVQALTLETHREKLFNVSVNAALSTAMQRIRMRGTLIAIVIGLLFGAIATVLWIGGHDVLEGKISPGDLSAFIFFSVLVAGSVGALSEIGGELQRAAGATERIMELLDTAPTITAPSPSVELPDEVEGHILFDHVTFHYPSRPDRAALTDFSLSIESGKTIALVGPSGAGKTTVFQLLLRFYDPTEGSVMLDGIGINRLVPQELRAHIGLVPQDPIIFSGNVWENIRCGKTSATEAEVIEAARAANALEFIEKLPEGFGSFLGEKGVRLSGGQKQRIAIARAIIRNPRILLLDEATSALDSQNELMVQAAIDRAMHNRTTLVIAHRLSTVLKADMIVVLNEGKIEASGTHEELLKRSSLYANLARLQFGSH